MLAWAEEGFSSAANHAPQAMVNIAQAAKRNKVSRAF
jgi:hypothetical protein